MTIKLPNLSIYYDNVTKVGSTSILHWLYRVAFGETFEKYKKNDQCFHIHNYQQDNSFDKFKKFTMVNNRQLNEKSRLSEEHFFYFCVIRDPVKRLISAYSNRVTFYQELSRKKIPSSSFRERNLKPNPDLNFFIENLENYQELEPSIWHHTQPMINFLDRKIQYTNVYDLSSIYSIAKDLKIFIDQEYRDFHYDDDVFQDIPKYQTGGKKFSLDYLSPRNFKKACEYYRSDYEYIGKLRNKYKNLPNISYESINEEYLNFLTSSPQEKAVLPGRGLKTNFFDK